MKQLYSALFVLLLNPLCAQGESAYFLKTGLKFVFFEILVAQNSVENVFAKDSTIYIISQNFFCLLGDSTLQSSFVEAIEEGEINKGNKKLVFLPYEKLFLISPNRYLIFEEIMFTSNGKIKLSFILDGECYSANNPHFELILTKTDLDSITVTDLKLMIFTEIENLKIRGLPKCNY
ncbi:MAG: hypothetical protein JJU02_01525 [Cryomorphaceae bacterium]|nr:hypothetical protein [Cryomorphaceae bacterium]